MLAFGVVLLAAAALAAPATPVNHHHHHHQAVAKNYNGVPERPTGVHQQQTAHQVVPPVQSQEGVANQNVSEDVVANARHARIIQQDSEVNPDGSHFNVWSSDNGINVQEQSVVQQVDDVVVPVVQGEISYVDNEGNRYHLTYVADQFGFRPQGDHLPTPPPLPAAIARGLEFAKAHPYVETTDQEKSQAVHGHAPVVVDN